MNSILKHLLHWFLFAGTMFLAAGATIDAGAISGGDDPGAGGDPGAEESGGGAETGADETAGAEETEGADPADRTQHDNRTLPKNIQTTLKTLAEQHPELKKELDELRKGYFDSRGHREFFKNPAEARQAKAALDLVGGHEGIANLRQQVAAAENLDSAFEQGDPVVIDDAAEDFPEGFKKLVPYALEKLEKMDAKAAFAATQPYAVRMLESAELGQRLNEAFAAIGANKLDDAKTIITNIYRWLEAQKQQAGQRRTEDPERTKLAADRQKFESEKESAFRQDIGRQTVAHQGSEIKRVLNADPRFRKLSKDAQADVMDGVNAEVNRRLKADNAYQNQMKAHLASRKRDASQIVSYVNSVVTEVAGKAAPFVMSRRYGNAPARTTTTTTTTDKTQQTTQRNPAQSGPIKLTAKPKREDVDWAKTKDVLYITNKAFMKNGPFKGKLVTW
jgi:hypothetical protein